MFQHHFSTKGQKRGVTEVQVRALEKAKIVLVLPVEIISEEFLKLYLIVSADGW